MSSLERFFQEQRHLNDQQQSEVENDGGKKETMTYREWLKLRNNNLVDFMMHRLISQSSDHDDIPHVFDTQNEVQRIIDIDLDANSVSLALLQVTKWSKERQTGRRSVKRSLSRQPKEDQWFPRFGFSANDGPLGTVYRHVLSVEVVQLSSKASKLQALAEKAVTSGEELQRPAFKRLCVFFYNSWAKKVGALFQRSEKQTLLLGIDVSSINVLPFPSVDWYDEHDMLPYCLCIGDRSMLQDDLTNNVRFHNRDTHVSVGWIPKNEDTPIGHDVVLNDDGKEIVVERQDDSAKGSLADLYTTFIAQKDSMPSEPEAAQPKDENDPEGPQPPDRKNVAGVEYQALVSSTHLSLIFSQSCLLLGIALAIPSGLH